VQEATMLYRAPGAHQIHGHDVDYIVVDAPQVDEHLAAGWHRSAVAAGEAHQAALAKAAAEAEEAADDNAAATREEIIQKLESLDVVFDRRLGEKKLAKLLDETLAARAPAAAGTGAP
jgi:uncharacterized protein (DUF1697 family)